MCYFGSKLLQNIAAMHICELILLAKFILVRERKRKKKKPKREICLLAMSFACPLLPSLDFQTIQFRTGTSFENPFDFQIAFCELGLLHSMLMDQV